MISTNPLTALGQEEDISAKKKMVNGYNPGSLICHIGVANKVLIPKESDISLGN